MSRFSKLFLINFLILVVLFPGLWIFAQNSDFEPEKTCPSFTKNIDEECQKLGVDKCRQFLENCEKYYQQKSEQYSSEIKQLQQKKKSLENEISVLLSKIKNLDSQIYKNNLIIKGLNFQIADTQSAINRTNLELSKIKENLANILQLRYEEDQKSQIEIFLSEGTFSDFFDNLMALEVLNLKTQELLTNLKDLKSSLEIQKDKMSEEKNQLEAVQLLVRIQKEENKNIREQKDLILEKTKGQEVLYQKYLKETKEKAEEIRKKIFELAQVPESQALTLEQAHNLSLEIERITRVRPAFLLAVLKIESDIGNNVGQCNCGSAVFCRHPEISWKEVMTERQRPYFEQITKELGLDLNKTPVSCSVNGGKVQWGGAMGPAQFMPETWLKLGYKERVENITGIRPANPWRVKDAFLAAGLYLADWGAASQKEIQEIGAARAYLCGTSTLTPICRIAGGESYVYNIMKYASQFQNYIDQGVFRD
ncbi:MAG: lytic murein transglycosylase [Patescibacteria group bacterium]|nr:lytic murein transglycosylase [Patescibacteria group bacterium]